MTGVTSCSVPPTTSGTEPMSPARISCMPIAMAKAPK